MPKLLNLPLKYDKLSSITPGIGHLHKDLDGGYRLLHGKASRRI